jgi:hypothetical protein
VDVRDIGPHVLGKAAHLLGGGQVPWRHGQGGSGLQSTGWVGYLGQDDVVAGACQQFRLGAHDRVLAARLAVAGVNLKNSQPNASTPTQVNAWMG